MVINSTTVTEPTARDQPTGGHGPKNGRTEHSGYRMKVDGTHPVFGDWRDDLVRDGYAVVKGAVPPSRALK